MEQVDPEGVACSLADRFVFQSRPGCSLTRGGERLVFWSLAALCFGSATAFSMLGYWLILPFAGLEIGLLGWALDGLRGRARDYESLSIDGDAVVLEWCRDQRQGRRELNRQWIRVTCDCAVPGRNCRVSVNSHGRSTEIGHYLSDEARLQLAATLRRKLQA